MVHSRRLCSSDDRLPQYVINGSLVALLGAYERREDINETSPRGTSSRELLAC